MKIKLNDKQYNFLLEHLTIERTELFIYFNERNNLVFEVDEDIACKIRDWAGEKLQREGFDIDYNLNDAGIILEQLVDLFYA